MQEFLIWTVPGSPFARAVMAALEEKGAPWRLKPLSPGEIKGEAHRARQPFGRMPAVEHGDFKLYETQAILRYIDRVCPHPALTPADPRDEARMNQLIGVNDWYFFPQVGAPLVFNRVIAPKIGLPVDEARVAAALPDAKLCISEIARLQGASPFLAGDALSLADLVLGPQLSYFAACAEGRAMLAAHPNLAAWVERMEARPSFAATTWDKVTEMAQAA